MVEAELTVIQVQKVPRPKSIGKPSLELLAEFCSHYPAYTLGMAREMPYPRVRMMMRVARRLEAARYANLLQIASVTNSSKGSDAKKLLAHYQGIIRNGE